MTRVLNGINALTAIMVAHHANERGDCPTCITASTTDQRASIQRLIRDAGYDIC